MKKAIIITIVFIFNIYNCISQNQNKEVIDISSKTDLNYILSNINIKESIEEKLYNRGLFVKIFKISDSKATPKDYFKESDQILESIVVSVTPDGDYYTSSKLYKIEGLLNFKILSIQEKEYPKFSLNVEFGNVNNRKIRIFEINSKYN